jgi:hypothetical protein
MCRVEGDGQVMSCREFPNYPLIVRLVADSSVYVSGVGGAAMRELAIGDRVKTS